MSEPLWLVRARALVGVSEIAGSKHEPEVVAFFAEAGVPEIRDDETAWCGAFVAAMLAAAGRAEVRPPGEISEWAMTKKLRQLVDDLAGVGIYFDNTDHLSDRVVYEKIARRFWQHPDEFAIAPRARTRLTANLTHMDEGEGFDPQEIADPLAPENILKSSGRGIFLIRNFMDEMDLRRAPEGGMEVVMVKRAQPQQAGAFREQEQLPGPLDDEEKKVMEKHTVHAREMLAPISFLETASLIPYCHHERWDGKGYPRGLKGDEIPWQARLFAVVDQWDALSSRRPYRNAWPQERVIDYIRENSGTRFDPEVVEAFLRIVG